MPQKQPSDPMSQIRIFVQKRLSPDINIGLCGRETLIAITVILIVWYFVYIRGIHAGLGTPPLGAVDESMYSNAARHMVKSGDWLTPKIYLTPGNLAPFFQKPPLLYWLQALSIKVFGVTSFATRLPVALCTLALSLVVFHIGRTIYDVRSGLAASLVLFVMPAVHSFGHGGRAAVTDIPLVLFGTLFVWWLWQARTDSRWFVLAGIAGGLAVLTKGPAAVTFPLVAAPFVLIYWRDYVVKRLIYGVLAGVFVAIPWPLVSWLSHGEVFLNQFILRQLRRSQGGFGTTGDPIFGFMNFPYFQYLLSSIAYAPFVIPAVTFAGWKIYRDGVPESRVEVFSIWWIFLVPLFYALTGGNHGWYILPIVVPVSLSLGNMAKHFTERINSAFSSQFDIEPITFSIYVLLGILAVSAAGIGYFNAPAQSTDSHMAIGVGINDVTSENTTIYLEEDVFDHHHTFTFYANRPIDEANISDINANRSIDYAVVRRSSLTQISRRYSFVVNTSQYDIVAIQLKDN